MLRMTRGQRIFQLFNGAVMLIIALMCLLPLINVLAVSLSTAEAASTGRVALFPIGFTTIAYTTIMQKPAFVGTFLTSVKRVLVGVPINMILIILAAYPLSKPGDRLLFRQFYVWAFVLTMLFSGGLIPFYLVVNMLKLRDSFWSLVIPFAVPVYNVILMVNFFKTIPLELEEAAIIDGAGQLRVLTRVFLPCSLPAIATLTLFCVVFHWNEWFYAQIFLSRIETFPLQSYLQQLLSQTKTANMQNLTLKEMEEMAKINTRTFNAAQIIVSAVPVLVIYPFLQRFFVTGLTLGGVKG